MTRSAQWVLSGMLILTAAASTQLMAQAPPPPKPRDGLLSGVVTNLNGVPLPRVEVLIINTDLKAITNDSGVYEFLAAPTGKLRLVARRIGFEPEEGSVSLQSNLHKQVDFSLKGMPEALNSVMVREAGGLGRMNEFWARRMNGNGAYITRDDIERRRPQRPSDLLRTVSGVRVVLGDGGFDHPVIAMSRNAIVTGGGRSVSPQCRVTYYVDGNYVAVGTFHMDDMTPSVIEGIEVYRGPSETPPRFRQRDTACGVIVIWTRDPSRREPGRPD